MFGEFIDVLVRSRRAGGCEVSIEGSNPSCSLGSL